MANLNIAFVENDSAYLNRLIPYLNDHYGQHLSVSSFTAFDVAKEELATAKMDIVLLDEDFADRAEELNGRGTIAILTVDECETFDGMKAIRKYQKANAIYTAIQGIYSEVQAAKNVQKKVVGSEDTSILLFMAASGGAGASTVAAATAVNLARRGARVLYMNLEDFGTASVYFDGPGEGGLENIILALKMKTASVGAQLKAAVRTDQSGVQYLASTSRASDLLSLEAKKVEKLLTEIVALKEYQYIVLDVSQSMSETAMMFLRLANRKFFVSNGTDVSNEKTKRLVEYFGYLEQKNEESLLNNASLLYNDFHNSSSKQVNGLLPIAGGFPHFNIVGARDLVATMSEFRLFEQLF